MKDKFPLVTVCIPAYNHEKYISYAIESVLNQTYKNIELIIINDGSKDNTSEIIKRYIEKFQKRFIRFEYRDRKNKGLPKTLNECLEWAKGKYFTGIASDDVMLPEKVEVLVNALESNPNCGIAFGDAFFINEKGEKILLHYKGKDLVKEVCKDGKINSFLEFYCNDRNLDYRNPAIFGSYQSLIIGNYLPAMSYVVKTDLLRKVGGWSEDNIIEDWDMWLKISKVAKFLFVDKPVALYRIHNTNTVILEKKKIKIYHIKLIEREKEYLRNLNKEFFFKVYTNYLILCIKCDKKKFISEILSIKEIKFIKYFVLELFKKIIKKFWRCFKFYLRLY